MFCVLYVVLCVVCCVLCIQQTHMIDLQPRVRCPRVPQLFAKTFLNSLLTKWLILTTACYWYPGILASSHLTVFPHFNIHSAPVPAALWSHATDNAQCFNGFQMLFVGFINSLCFYLYLVLSYALFSIRVHQFDTLCCLQLKWRKPSPIKTTVGGDNLWTRIVAAAFSEYYAIVAFWKLWWLNWGTLL